MNFNYNSKLFAAIMMFAMITIMLSSQAFADVPSPKKQIALGVAEDDIICKQSFIKAMRINSEYPICIKPDSAMKLVDRGMIEQIFTSKKEISITVESVKSNNLNAPTFNKLFKFSTLVCGETICSDESSFRIKYDKSSTEELIKTQKKSNSEDKAIEFMKKYYRTE